MANYLGLVLSALGTMTAPGIQAPVDVREVCQATFLSASRRDAKAYQQRAATYCDGEVVERFSGSGELPVIGVMAGGIDGDPASHPLVVAVLPSAASREVRDVLRVQAVARQPADNYRLDAWLPATAALRIGPESGLAKVSANIKVAALAWSAWGESPEHGRTYYPIGLQGAVAREVEITVRPGFRAASIIYSVEVPGRPASAEATISGNARSGEPVSFSIPIGDASIASVRVTAIALSGRTQVAAIRLALPAGAKP